MALNEIHTPELNPVLFFREDRVNDPKFFTHHFEKWPYGERFYEWETPMDYIQIWQDTDIINFQFESTFDPIILQLVDMNGEVIIDLPALIGVQNLNEPNLYMYEASMSLAGVDSGCYRIRRVLGSSGPLQVIETSKWMYISEDVIENSLLLEYWDSADYHKDVIFKGNILGVPRVKFQFRVLGHFGHLKKIRKDEVYRDQQFDTARLSSRSAKQFAVYFGDEFGLPDDIYNLLEEIWSCDNVLIDNKPFGLAEGTEADIIEVEGHNKRGFKYTLEEGINRHSRITSVNTDDTKRLLYSVNVSAKAFGDTGTQNAANTVPVLYVE